MESYKHSCPFCGQHIEYTVEYCGQRMACPSCGKDVVFPAVPPGGKKKPLQIKRAAPARTAKWSFNPNDILACLRQFQHWNIVLVCVVPFVILGALLIGAHALKKQTSDEPAAPEVHADANAWQKMTALAKADQVVQQQIGVVAQARAMTAAAQRTLDSLHAYYHGKTLDPATFNIYAAQRKADEQACANAQKMLDSANQSFNRALQNYQQLGGTIDYRQQLPR
jgi:hypothetical protein